MKANNERQKLMFTPREKEIIFAICENGMANTDLCIRFNVKKVTIDKQLESIFNKTGMSTRCELVAYMLNGMCRFWAWMEQPLA